MRSGVSRFQIRPARRREHWLMIRRILREGLDPSSLDWRRFVVAESSSGDILGFAQIKDLGQGVQEFGSLVVEPHVRGEGIGSALLRHLVASTPKPVYLLCGARNVSYYRRFGFREVSIDEMPSPLRRKWRVGSVFARLLGSNVAAMVYA